MKITYDPEVDAPSITFRDTTVTIKHLAEGIAADYASDGRLAGLEILDAIKALRWQGDAASSHHRRPWSRPTSIRVLFLPFWIPCYLHTGW